MIDRVPGPQLEHQERAQRVLACLGDRSRFRVVSELLAGERCVSDLATSVGLSQSCTTRHLQTLEREGLVVGARQGKRVVYRVRTEAKWVDALLGWAIAAESTSRGLMTGRSKHPGPTIAPREPREPREPRDPSMRPIEPMSAPAAASGPDPSSAPREAPRRSEIEDFLL